MSMPVDSYQLGIDLGTTYTAAAVARGDQVKIVGLGNRGAAIPSVIHLAGDGTVLTGDAAERRAPGEPDRVAREFKRRIGDTTPLLLGGTPYSAEALTAQLLHSVLAKVAELEGGPPSHITVTHPANWGPYKKDLLEQAIRMAGASAAMLTEPEAAAIAYASNERVEPGSTVAVYDLGGGTFDAAVLNKTHDGFAILGQPEGIERLGGIDFDEAVVQHVRTALHGALDRLDFDDPATMAALIRLRRECIEAKEALSADTETAIPVVLPGLQTDVRLTRGEFEQMVGPTLAATVDAMRRALGSARIEPHQITAVLLVGGSSRIPLVAQLVSDAFGRPVAVDAHPKHAVALGAAHHAAAEAQRSVVAQPAPAEPAAPLSTVIAMGSPGVPVDAPGTAALASAGADDDSGWLPAQNGTTRQAEIAAPVEEFPPWVGEDDEPGNRTRRMLWIAIAATIVLGGLLVVPGALATNDPPEPVADVRDNNVADDVSEPAEEGSEDSGDDAGDGSEGVDPGTGNDDGAGGEQDDGGDNGGDTRKATGGGTKDDDPKTTKDDAKPSKKPKAPPDEGEDPASEDPENPTPPTSEPADPTPEDPPPPGDGEAGGDAAAVDVQPVTTS
jgi:actin-like ATPase involved in cell morphogenesis